MHVHRRQIDGCVPPSEQLLTALVSANAQLSFFSFFFSTMTIYGAKNKSTSWHVASLERDLGDAQLSCIGAIAVAADGRCSDRGKLGDGEVREAMEGRELVRKKTVGIDLFGWCVTRVVKEAAENTMHASRSSTRDFRAVANAKLRR